MIRTRAEVAQMKEASVDPLLAELIIARTVVDFGGTQDDRYRRVGAALCLDLRAVVDDTIVDVVEMTGLDHLEVRLPAKQWQVALTTHDDLSKAFKKLILFAYGDIDSRDLRRRVDLCNAIAIGFVNSQDFYGRIRAAAGAESLSVKKHRARKHYVISYIRDYIGL